MTAEQVAVGERGSTVIADRVMTKIATQAAREALDAVPSSTAPKVQVRVHHGAAQVRVGVELDYPCDIGARCGAVRRQVATRVTGLAGLDVPDVQVKVERLHSAESRRAAHGRAR